MPEGPTPRPVWPRAALVIGLLSFTGVSLATNVMPARDDVHATRRLLELQERENEESRTRIDELREAERALREDPGVVRRALREQLHLSDEGEIIVR